jgi:tRNA (mo5U34)-methyltransferase
MSVPDPAPAPPQPSSELLAELRRPPAFMYEWPLGPHTPPVLHPELLSVHATRRDLMQEAVADALRAAGPGARALDLACNEGWWCHRLLEWGASEVVGIDIRPQNVRRAELLRDQLGVSRERLRVLQGDVFEVSPEALGTFDVVLLLGLVYHVEDPIGAMRRAAALTRRLCVIESQLTRQTEPIVFGWGATGPLLSSPAGFAMLVEPDRETNALAAQEGAASLVPNRAALELSARVAGFGRVDATVPRQGYNPQYLAGDRVVILASADDAGARPAPSAAAAEASAGLLRPAPGPALPPDGDAAVLRAELEETRTALVALTGSRSWRLTRPLRAAAARVRTRRGGGA